MDWNIEQPKTLCLVSRWIGLGHKAGLWMSLVRIRILQQKLAPQCLFFPGDFTPSHAPDATAAKGFSGSGALFSPLQILPLADPFALCLETQSWELLSVMLPGQKYRFFSFRETRLGAPWSGFGPQLQQRDPGLQHLPLEDRTQSGGLLASTEGKAKNWWRRNKTPFGAQIHLRGSDPSLDVVDGRSSRFERRTGLFQHLFNHEAKSCHPSPLHPTGAWRESIRPSGATWKSCQSWPFW